MLQYSSPPGTFDEPVKTIEFFQQGVWTNEDGLPMNTVMDIVQTPDGYIWVGTEMGLARFDGEAFDIFNRDNTPALTSNVILCLLKDSRDQLWIGTRGGGPVLYKNGTFQTLPQASVIARHNTWKMMESMDGSTWIATQDGLYRFADGKMNRIQLPGKLTQQDLLALLEDRNGRIWLGTGGSGLVWLSKLGSGFESECVGPPGMIVSALFEDRRGNIWIGTIEQGVFIYRDDIKHAFSTKNGLSNNTIRCFYEDRFDNIWIGTEGGGINLVPAGRKQVVPFHNREEFSNNVIFCFYEDREGTLWVGTNGGGLNSLRESRITTYSIKHGLSYNSVYGVFQDSRDRVWVGTKGYGVNYFQDGRFHTLTTRDGLSSNSVVSIAEDRQGNLWFGTLGGGINRYRDGHVEVFDTKRGLSYNSLRCVYVDPVGTVWAGTIKGTVYRLENGEFKLVVDIKHRVNVMHGDKMGNLWMGSFGGGLFRLDKNANITVIDETHGLSSNIITRILEDGNGGIWLGTPRGINYLKDGNIKWFGKKQGLPDDVIYSLMEDHQENFWVGCNHGIYRLCRAEVTAFIEGKTDRVNPTLYGKEAGMLSSECNGGNQPSGWRTRDGKLWFPTTNGVSVIDPRNLGINKMPPPVIIKDLLIDGTPQDIPLEKPLPPGRNNLEIHYAALSYCVPGKIRFKYMLEGYDTEWTDAGGERLAYYTDLPPGDYLFKVIACNSDGTWNREGAQLSIKLDPRFYQTSIFHITAAAMLLGILLGSYCILKKRYTLRVQKNKNASTPMPPDEIEKCLHKLYYLLEEEKLYRESDITVKTLASRLLITPRSLSQVINDQLKKSFYEFISQFRIEEAQQILKNPETRDKPIIDIAYEVGYNSKSAFNRAFKTMTGMTPSEFRKTHKE